MLLLAVAPIALVGGAIELPIGAPVASAMTNHCLVIDATSGTSFSTLQPAVDAANAGDTLWIRGTCIGATQIDHSLTLTGQQPRGFGAPTLDGGNADSVLAVFAATLTLNNLTVTHGNSIFGGGVYNAGAIVVNNSAITGNNAGYGAGIFDYNGDSATLDAGSVVSDNVATYAGGGVYHNGVGCTNESGPLTLSGGGIEDNSAPDGAGVYNSFGTVNLDSGSIDGNIATGAGGGIYNVSGTINGDTGLVHDNTPDPQIYTASTCGA